MPTPCYLKLTQGGQDIPGTCTEVGHEKTIKVQAVEHVMDYAHNLQTLAVTGTAPIMGMLLLTKEIDKASATLCQSLVSKKQFDELELTFYRNKKDGQDSELYYTIKLEKCHLVKLRTWVANCMSGQAESADLGHMEELGFIYEKIFWTGLAGASAQYPV